MYGPLSAEYYDIVKPKAFPEEISFYQKKLKNKHDLILDCMCGSGRLLLPLLREGFNIEGIDYSQAMIERCSQQGKKYGVTPILYKQSIPTMSIPKKYKVIMIAGGSFQLIYPRDSAIKALQTAKNHLAEGGRLFVDTFVPWELLYENAEKEEFVNEVKDTHGNLIKRKTYSISNKQEQCFISYNQYQKLKDKKVIAQEEDEMSVLWYYHYEMLLLLQLVGFSNVIAHDKAVGKHPELTIYEATI